MVQFGHLDRKPSSIFNIAKGRIDKLLTSKHLPEDGRQLQIETLSDTLEVLHNAQSLQLVIEGSDRFIAPAGENYPRLPITDIEILFNINKEMMYPASVDDHYKQLLEMTLGKKIEIIGLLPFGGK